MPPPASPAHDNAQPSLYRHTMITRAGRSTGEGHTGQTPVIRPNNSTITFVDSLNSYQVDPDGPGPAETLSFGKPDFNFKSLRGNAVLRWEYMPGSTLYFVWTQSRSDFEDTGEFNFGASMARMLQAPAENILMIKATYWWNP